MSSTYRDGESGAEWNWLDIVLQNVRLLAFLVLASAGMFFVHWYFTPEAGDPASVAAAAGLPIAPLADGRPQKPVLQRFNQGSGPTYIAIISGHRASDAGAVCDDGMTEAEVNESIATQVVETLRQSKIEAELFDEFDPRLAGFRGTALISIHADSCVYYNELATGYKVAGSSYSPSDELLHCMEQAYGRVTGLPYNANTITPHMTDYHAFREISAETPAVIIETGFMNLDRELLTQRQELPIEGIVDGIRCFLETVP